MKKKNKKLNCGIVVFFCITFINLTDQQIDNVASYKEA